MDLYAYFSTMFNITAIMVTDEPSTAVSLPFLKQLIFTLLNIHSICKLKSGTNDREEQIVGKGYQHFLLFKQCFQKASFSNS